MANAKTNKGNHFKYENSDVSNDTGSKTREIVEGSKTGGNTSRRNRGNKRGAGRVGHSNDSSWYYSNEQALRDVASFPYGYQSGLGIERRTKAGLGTPVADPGVCALITTLGVGTSLDGGSPLNMAAYDAFISITANSGRVNTFDAPDVMLYYLAMDSVFSLIAYIQRLYGSMWTYNPENRYVPRTLVEACDIDYQDLSEHMMDYRARLNTLITLANNLPVPKKYDLFLRHIWMFSNFYADAPTDAAQIYEFVPLGFYQYEPIAGQTGGKLEFKTVYNVQAGAQHTVKDLLDLLEQMISNLINDQDINHIAALVENRYTRAECVSMNLMGESYTVAPIYNAEVLSQIENLTAIGYPVSDNGTNITLDIIQNNGILYWCPIFQPMESNSNLILGNSFLRNKIINMHHEGVSCADTMVATRLTTIVTDDNSNIPTAMGYTGNYSSTALFNLIDSCGSEVINAIYIYTRTYTQGSPSSWNVETSPALFTAKGFSISDALDAANVLLTVGRLENFDWHPQINIYSVDPQGTATYSGQFFDVDNYTLIDANQFRAMHLRALLALLSVDNA